MPVHKHLAAAAAAVALVSGALAVGPADAASRSTGSASGAAAQAGTSRVPSTTVWIHGKAAHVWKTWHHYSGGGYKGHFGATSVDRDVQVMAEIYWNSGRYQIVPVKPRSTHTYNGARAVYLRAWDWHGQNMYCGDRW
ncbi:hypothetical protein [Streptomyces coffeae]|uniref:Lactococcin 972 family bacteriocin n=1 Tax=Streptomyces coffeae TaxID=621382 RepID=A0ABS1NJI8_9ACTN|nr:hypothetical protein [Streptomyces coffeae]MBL1100262.1 hypothetical protein [Streptomyces coffeae]